MFSQSQRYIGTLLFVAPLLTSCVTMGEKECRTADWYETGYRDGRNGQPRSQIEDIAESCAAADTAPDRDRYFAGRAAGLREYCTPANAYAVGKSGASNRDVCPPSVAGRFDTQYQLGYRVYQARERIDKLEKERKSLERKLTHADSEADRKKLRDKLAVIDKRLRNERDDLQLLDQSAQH